MIPVISFSNAMDKALAAIVFLSFFELLQPGVKRLKQQTDMPASIQHFISIKLSG
jgi:hypothetical protein